MSWNNKEKILLVKLNIYEFVLKYSPKTGREGPEREWRGTSTCLILILLMWRIW
jgi:hypothetical protein